LFLLRTGPVNEVFPSGGRAVVRNIPGCSIPRKGDHPMTRPAIFFSIVVLATALEACSDAAQPVGPLVATGVASTDPQRQNPGTGGLAGDQVKAIVTRRSLASRRVEAPAGALAHRYSRCSRR